VPIGANATPSNSSGDAQIDGIVSNAKWGFTWSDRTLTYSFYEDSIFGGAYYGAETGVREVSEGVKSNVRSILKNFSSFINVNFQEVTETNTNYGRLRFMLSNAPTYAYAYLPTSDALANVAGDVHLTPIEDVGESSWNGFQNPAGSHGYMSLIHEVGHALGLKHPHDDTPLLPVQSDNTTNTVMTYNFTGNPAATAMPLDIKALQYLYGSRSNNSANNTYQFTGKVDQYSVDGQQFFSTPNSTKQTIWDTDGVDTLDFSNLSIAESGYRLDMNSGGILTTNTAFNSVPYENQLTTSYGSSEVMGINFSYRRSRQGVSLGNYRS
jgi:serralysin